MHSAKLLPFLSYTKLHHQRGFDPRDKTLLVLHPALARFIEFHFKMKKQFADVQPCDVSCKTAQH